MDPSKYAYYPQSLQPPTAPPPPYNASMYPNLGMPQPAMPSNDYRVVVRGQVNKLPKEFAIDIVSNGQILFHMNPRFYEKTTVFNSKDLNGWGPEVRCRFNTLAPKSNFLITIQSSSGIFHVDVNGEKFVYQQRLAQGRTRAVHISKVNQKDVNISSMEIIPI